jgi:6-phosphogluconolactonase
MDNHEIIVFPTIDKLAEFVAGLLNTLIAETADGEYLTIALSGGSTPKQIFRHITSHDTINTHWERVRFFWVDERCVPAEDDESNYKMTRQNLFENLAVPEGNIFRIHGENDPEKEAVRYSSIIAGNVPVENNWPHFDVLLLGLGEDGHTASIFPGNTALFQSLKSCEVAAHPISGQQRITLTGPVINNASQVIFLVTGPGKASVVAKILQDSNTGLPASFVKPLHGNLTWLLDADAAGKLKNGPLQQ